VKFNSLIFFGYANPCATSECRFLQWPQILATQFAHETLLEIGKRIRRVDARSGANFRDMFGFCGSPNGATKKNLSTTRLRH
jgi:hypothetical protein